MLQPLSRIKIKNVVRVFAAQVLGFVSDPKSPNFSKTPPPSPADFLNQRQVASAQGEFVWCSLVCS